MYKKFLKFKKNIDTRHEYIFAVCTGYMLMGVNITVQILLVPLYLKNLGEYQFGILMVLLAFVNYASIGTSWMVGGVLRVMTEHVVMDDHEGFDRTYALAKLIYVGYALFVALGLVGVVSVFEASLFGDMSTQQRTAMHLSTLAVAAYVIVQFDFSVERLVCIATGQQAAGNIFQIVSLVVFVVTVIPWLSVGGGLAGVLLCLVGGVVTARLMSWAYWRSRGLQVRWRWPDEGMRVVLRRLVGPMGLGYFLYGALVMTMQADALLVAWLGGAAMVAEFVLVWKVAEMLVQVLWRLPEYYQPYLMQMDARGEHKQLRASCERGLRWLVGISLLVGVGYGLLGPWVVGVWVGPEYRPSEPLGYVLAGAGIFWLGSARLPAIVAYATVRLKKLVSVAGIEVLGKLLLSLALFPKMGYLAPLAAISLTHMAGVFFLYRRLVR
jgi:O-antigen/teichoic acid export membrane protein